jgi:hypothetical protein
LGGKGAIFVGNRVNVRRVNNREGARNTFVFEKHEFTDA